MTAWADGCKHAKSSRCAQGLSLMAAALSLLDLCEHGRIFKGVHILASIQIYLPKVMPRVAPKCASHDTTIGDLSGIYRYVSEIQGQRFNQCQISSGGIMAKVRQEGHV